MTELSNGYSAYLDSQPFPVYASVEFQRGWLQGHWDAEHFTHD